MLLTQQWWVPYLVRPQTQTWNTRNQHNVHNVRPPHAGNAWWVGCVGCHKCRASAVGAQKKKMRFCRARWSEVKRCLSRVRSENGIVFENFVASFRSLHTICSTEGLKMLRTCFLRWWKAQFLDIGVKTQLELGISLKLETFFSSEILGGFSEVATGSCDVSRRLVLTSWRAICLLWCRMGLRWPLRPSS